MPNKTDQTCSVENCSRPVRARGLCRKHYDEWRATRAPDLRPHMPREETCREEGCSSPVKARGWCGAHYQRWRRTGTSHPQAVLDPNVCQISECPATATRKGFCERHYRQARKKGLVGWDGTICAVADCDRPAIARDRCDLHYQQLLLSERAPCSIEDCDRPVFARGWCQIHYTRWNRWGDPLAWKKRKRQICEVEGCQFTQVARGLCNTHYRRQKRYGMTGLPPRSTVVKPQPFACKQCGLTLGPKRSGFCSPECRQAWEHWERKKTHRRRWLKPYGLTEETFDQRIADQRGRCRLCDEPLDLDADDFRDINIDHVDLPDGTRFVRGILHRKCNVGMGHYDHDPDRIRDAADYLEKYGPDAERDS